MSRCVRVGIGVAAALVGGVLASGHVFAQAGAFGWSPNDARLTDTDNRMLWQTMDAMNKMPSPVQGETRNWSNPASGNSGTVTLARLFESKGLPCHALHYTISFASQPVPQNYDFNWCRISDGEWRIAS